jgi:hypothetical protein
MSSKNIAILIPSTSRGRNWTKFEDCDLVKHTMASFYRTYDKEHKYSFFIGVDEDDTFYNNEDFKKTFFHKIGWKKHGDIQDVSIDFVEFSPQKGNVVFIWNELFKKAFNFKHNGVIFDYFHQTGDDIEYMDKGWVNTAIKTLEASNDLGVVGHTDWTRKAFNPDDKLLTQTFVGRSHFEMLGYYFHPYLRNWFCDNYITDLYGMNKLLYQIPHRIQNLGGPPRYNVDNAVKLCGECVCKDHWKIPYFIECKKRIIGIL